MKTIAVLLLTLAACGSPAQTTLHFEIWNTTPVPLTFVLGEGVLSRTITLNPGEQWLGSIDPRYVPKRLPVVISTK